MLTPDRDVSEWLVSASVRRRTVSLNMLSGCPAEVYGACHRGTGQTLRVLTSSLVPFCTSPHLTSNPTAHTLASWRCFNSHHYTPVSTPEPAPLTSPRNSMMPNAAGTAGKIIIVTPQHHDGHDDGHDHHGVAACPVLLQRQRSLGHPESHTITVPCSSCLVPRHIIMMPCVSLTWRITDSLNPAAVRAAPARNLREERARDLCRA
eukprot:466206-Rhodomonas_salina.2